MTQSAALNEAPEQAQPCVDPGYADFEEYFVKNYPGPETIIGDPKWHAPRIWRAALHCLGLSKAARAARAAEYQRANPRGGPAKMFDAMADAIRAGDDYATVCRNFEVTVHSIHGDINPQASTELPTSTEQHNASWVDPLTPAQAQTELIEILIKCGRRCAYDLAHAASAHLHGRRDLESYQLFADRSKAWLSIFNSGGDAKNYRISLYQDIDRLESRVQKLTEELAKHGVELPEEF